MKLTDRTVANLPLSERGKQQMYPCDTIPGFGCRVGSTAKSFVIIVGAERQRITLGKYPFVTLSQAREKARTILAKRQLGFEEPIPSPQFKDLFRAYLADRQDSVRRSTRLKDGYIGKNLDPLSDRPLDKITPTMVQAIIDAQSSMWSRHYTHRMFASFVLYAQKQGHMDNWPLQRIGSKLVVTPRERVLTEDELRRVLITARHWQDSGAQFGTIVELLILTGQRRAQIGSLDRSEVDFDAGTLTWSAERMKSKKRHAIPMGKVVRDILEPMQVNGLYFTNQYGHPFSAWSVWFERFRKDAGFRNWTLHDLRRTLATNWQRLGVNIETTEKMLAHSTITGGLVGIYQRHSYLREMEVAIQKWEDFISRL